MTTNDTHSLEQAKAQLASIQEMMAALEAANAGDDSTAQDEAQSAILEDPLSIEVRSGWVALNQPMPDTSPAEFRILLCTGGPAVQIVGELDGGEPETARIQHQDWGTQWQDLPMTEDERSALLTYCQQFCFAE